MTEERLNELKDNTYYDQTGKQILVGDLLKVFHFKVRKRTHYMYHVAVMEETKDFPVMAVRAHYKIEPHCRMYAITKDRIYRDAKIISELDFETKRKRIKIKSVCDLHITEVGKYYIECPKCLSMVIEVKQTDLK